MRILDRVVLTLIAGSFFIGLLITLMILGYDVPEYSIIVILVAMSPAIVRFLFPEIDW